MTGDASTMVSSHLSSGPAATTTTNTTRPPAVKSAEEAEYEERRNTASLVGSPAGGERNVRALVRELLPQILRTRGREVYLKDLIVAIAGFSQEDRDEPVTEEFFGDHKSYRHYLEKTVYFVDQFDFLLHCVDRGVCEVRDAAGLHAMLSAVTAPPARENFQFPPSVIAYDTLKAEDEERRIESFTLRKDWVSTVQ